MARKCFRCFFVCGFFLFSFFNSLSVCHRRELPAAEINDRTVKVQVENQTITVRLASSRFRENWSALNIVSI